MTEYSYTVTYDPNSTNQDITNFVQSIEWIETGSGEIQSASMVLDAREGAFITNADFSGVGNTPIIDEFDRIELSVTDRASANRLWQFEVDILKPIQNAQQGTVLEVQMLGLEHHLMRMPFSKPFFFEDTFTVVKDIIDIYNDNKGDAQPSISDHDNTTGNLLPKFTSNHFTFHLSEQPCYDALTNVVDRIGSSVAAGGAGDFYEFYFVYNAADLNDIKLRAFISGTTDSGVTITDSVAVNPAEEEGGIHSTPATVSATWGADNFGSLPAQVSQFAGALEAWRLGKNWEAGTYPANSIIRRKNTGPDSQGDELHFKNTSGGDTTETPPTTESNGTDWVSYNFTDFLTNEIGISGQYSPWTNARDDGWKNSGANPDGTQNDDPPVATSLYVWDGNQVVYDGSFYRTDVDWQGTNSASVPTQYLFGGSSFHRGFKVLVNGAGIGQFDASGETPARDFDNKVIRHNGGTAGDSTDWDIFRNPANGEFVACDDDAKVYEKGGGTWSDASGNDKANDCYHAVVSISNVQGHNDKNNGAGGDYGDSSAVQYEFAWEKNDITAFTDRKYYRAGAWINLKFPFPFSSYNAETIGSQFGNATKLEPSTLDTSNMHFTPTSGDVGFNNSEADELGPLDGIKFMTDFEWRYNKDGSGNLVRAGNFPCKCIMYDTSDNVVEADFTIGHNNNWEQIYIPFSAFKPYRARIPWSKESAGSNIFLQDIEILNVFEFKNIKKICFQWMGPYDNDGRYAPFLNISFLFPNIEDFLAGLFLNSFNIKWKIDAFHFSKPLLSVSDPVTGASNRGMFKSFHQEPLISNRYQLDQANLASLEIDQFRYKKFEVVTEGIFNINFGETFTLSNTELVNDSDSGANTIDLVAKKITYKIDKPSTGVGGFIRTLLGVKRFT